MEVDLKELIRTLRALEKEESEGDRSFYLPEVPRNFYYNPEVLRKLVTPDLSILGKLVIPDLRKLRR